MKNTRHFLPALIAAVLLLMPATGLCDRKITYSRDLDRDGHYNKKTIELPRRSYGYPYYYSRPYSYYGGRPYYYGPRTSVGLYLGGGGYSSGRGYYSGRSSYADDLAVDVQRELRRRGYYRGTIDGDIGPRTRAAIRSYQIERGLAVTGRIDRSLIRSLDIG